MSELQIVVDDLPDGGGDGAGFRFITHIKEDLIFSRSVQNKIKKSGFALASLSDSRDNQLLIWRER